MSQARDRANALEKQAVGLEAEKLAREPLQGGRRRNARPKRWLNQDNLPAARQGFLDAAQRYSDAVRIAQGQRELRTQADQAKAAMLASKQGARPDSTDYGSAAEQERQASQFYDRLAFKESIAAFRAAGDLYGRAAVAPQKPPPRHPPPPTTTMPPVARTGSVLVRSNVAGAAVSVGGVSFEARREGNEVPLPVGTYPVRARLSGYKEWSGQVEIVQDRRSEVQISLEPLPLPAPPKPPPPPSAPACAALADQCRPLSNISSRSRWGSAPGPPKRVPAAR